MNRQNSRREFLADVGRGTLVATLGGAMAVDLGLTDRRAIAEEPKKTEQRVTFGGLEPLVDLLQSTPADTLMATLVAKLDAGTPLTDLVAAGAYANVRTFGGEDYVGFHTVMALAPALHMAHELPADRRALPVLKVLHRNTNRIHEFGGKAKEVLKTVEDPLCECCLPDRISVGEALKLATRAKDMTKAEATFAALADRPEDMFNALLEEIQENAEVHRTVLPYRSWDLMGLIGREQAHALLRQAVRYCVKSERDWGHSAQTDRPRKILPALFDQHLPANRKPGDKKVDDAWIERMSRTFFNSTPEAAADAAAMALAEGIEPDAVGQAITLAANQLVLRDKGRTGKQVQPGKPEGSVHGDSIGVHASDSANAWRNMAKVSNARNTFACLILGAFQVADDRVNRGGDFTAWQPWPRPEDLAELGSSDPATLLKELPSAIRSNEQARAAAIVERIGSSGGDAASVFPILLDLAVSEDGALHAEKFYRTVREEFASTRPAFRWRHLVALARVTASEYGRPAPGVAEARSLLKV